MPRPQKTGLQRPGAHLVRSCEALAATPFNDDEYEFFNVREPQGCSEPSVQWLAESNGSPTQTGIDSTRNFSIVVPFLMTVE